MKLWMWIVVDCRRESRRKSLEREMDRVATPTTQEVIVRFYGSKCALNGENTDVVAFSEFRGLFIRSTGLCRVLSYVLCCSRSRILATMRRDVVTS